MVPDFVRLGFTAATPLPNQGFPARFLGIQVFLDGAPVNSHFPFNRSKRHPLAPGFLNRLPPLLLEECWLAPRGGCRLAGCGHVVDVTFREDQCRVRKDHGPQNLATLRQISHNLLKNENTVKVLLGKDAIALVAGDGISGPQASVC